MIIAGVFVFYLLHVVAYMMAHESPKKVCVDKDSMLAQLSELCPSLMSFILGGLFLRLNSLYNEHLKHKFMVQLKFM